MLYKLIKRYKQYQTQDSTIPPLINTPDTIWFCIYLFRLVGIRGRFEQSRVVFEEGLCRRIWRTRCKVVWLFMFMFDWENPDWCSFQLCNLVLDTCSVILGLFLYCLSCNRTSPFIMINLQESGIVKNKICKLQKHKLK